MGHLTRKMAPPRFGHHPREPRKKGRAEPTQEATHRDLPPDELEDSKDSQPPVDEPHGYESPSYTPDSGGEAPPLKKGPQPKDQKKGETKGAKVKNNRSWR